MIWIFVMLINGIAQDVAVFSSARDCEQAIAVYSTAQTRVLVWCEGRRTNPGSRS
jgi:hypothetical protein